jgi:hypothetical protein
MFNQKNISKTIALCLGVLVMSFLVGYLVFAWTEPSQTPPSGNVYAPINVGPDGQTKEGGILVANNSGVTYGLIVRYGTVGIGTTTPDTNYKLDVNGKIATPYLKSPFAGDINKNGDIDFYDLRLTIDCFNVYPGHCNPSTGCCWDTVIGADNLGNYLYGRDADVSGDTPGVPDGVVNGKDTTYVILKYKNIITPYTYQPRAGDINKDGYTNHEDIYFTVRMFGKTSADPEWNQVIGADNLGNYLYGRDADVSGPTVGTPDGRVDTRDLTYIVLNYTPNYFFQAYGYSNLPAAYLIGADSTSSNFALKVENSSANRLFYVRNDGNIGIGTDSPGAKLHIANCPTGSACLKLSGGDAKLDVGVVDPILTINGKNYATYLADFAGGTRIETSGTIEIENKKAEIEFENLKEGSDLWLFWQASNKNINDLTVLLTPSFEGKVWYEKNGNKITIYGEKSGEVSYRFSAPRFDYQKWQNLAQDQNLPGLIVPKH